MDKNPLVYRNPKPYLHTFITTWPIYDNPINFMKNKVMTRKKIVLNQKAKYISEKGI